MRLLVCIIGCILAGALSAAAAPTHPAAHGKPAVKSGAKQQHSVAAPAKAKPAKNAPSRLAKMHGKDHKDMDKGKDMGKGKHKGHGKHKKHHGKHHHHHHHMGKNGKGK